MTKGEFNWDDDFDAAEDMFAQAENQDKDPIESPKKVDGEEEDPDEDKATDKEEDEDLFKEVENSEEEDEESNEEDDDTDAPPVVGKLSETINSLIEDGLLFNDGEDPIDDSNIAEKLPELIESTIKNRMTELPDEAKEVLSYLINGGTLGQYLDEISATPGIYKDIDLTDEDNQEDVIRVMLEKDGEDDDFIDEQIELYKTSGKLATMASKYYQKWEQADAKKRADADKNQQKRALEAKQELAENKTKIANAVKDVKNIGFQFNQDIAKDLPKFVHEKSIKLNNNSFITPLQKELYFEIPKNPTAMAQLAILVKSRKADGTFDFSSISREATTRATRETKKDIRSKETPDISKKPHKKMSLAEMFSTDD